MSSETAPAIEGFNTAERAILAHALAAYAAAKAEAKDAAMRLRLASEAVARAEGSQEAVHFLPRRQVFSARKISAFHSAP
jgi:hypothetical protein